MTTIDPTAPTPSQSIGGAVDANAPSATTAFGTVDKDAFMKLLVAQMRYQNPMSPVDGQEYVAQAAQMAMVERLDGLAKAQSEVVSYQQVLLSTSLVGKEVTGRPSADADPVTGTVTGVHFKAGVPLLVLDGKTDVPVGFVEQVQTAGSDTPDQEVAGAR